MTKTLPEETSVSFGRSFACKRAIFKLWLTRCSDGRLCRHLALCYGVSAPLLLLLFAFLFFYTPFVHAGDRDSMVRLTCDSKQNYLLIEEFREQMDFDVPYPRVIKPTDMTISLRGLMWATESVSGVVTWHNKSIQRICHLGKHTFVATLNGYKFNKDILGMCGGGSSVLSLTIHKDGKLVAKDLVFDMTCASTKEIKSIRLDAKENLALITFLDIDSESESQLSVSTTAPISRKSLFGEDSP